MHWSPIIKTFRTNRQLKESSKRNLHQVFALPESSPDLLRTNNFICRARYSTGFSKEHRRCISTRSQQDNNRTVSQQTFPINLSSEDDTRDNIQPPIRGRLSRPHQRSSTPTLRLQLEQKAFKISPFATTAREFVSSGLVYLSRTRD